MNTNYSWKDKCPRCGYSPRDDFKKMTFTEFMDLTIKRVSIKQKEELGYGIPETKSKKRSKKAR